MNRISSLQPAFSCLGVLALASLVAKGDNWDSRHSSHSYSSKAPVLRQYSLDDRIRYQLWDYTWNPNPDEPITRIKISLSQQRVYVYQDSGLAGESPITTGKKGHETPTGHYSIIVKDIGPCR
jgi:hypothetical protein